MTLIEKKIPKRKKNPHPGKALGAISPLSLEATLAYELESTSQVAFVRTDGIPMEWPYSILLFWCCFPK